MTGRNDDLVFVTKTSGGTRTANKEDVSVTFVEDRQYAAFSFSAKAIAMMGNPDCLTAAQKLGKIYFKPSDQRQGFRLSGKTDSGRKIMRTSAVTLKMSAQNWVGYYRLQ